jgi:hypothetical protein
MGFRGDANRKKVKKDAKKHLTIETIRFIYKSEQRKAAQ